MFGGIAAALDRYGWLVGSIGVLCAVYLLPSDVSLAEVRRTGVLSACLPPSRPPLITGDPGHPGMEVELLQAIAGEIGVRFVANTIASIGQDFDPSLWQITHGQCAIIGGGMLDTRATRSFLDVSPAYGETGWMKVAKTADEPLAGRTAIVFANVPGADRVALSQFLRAQNVTVQLARSTDAIASALQDGTADFAITDALFARALAAEFGLVASALPPPLTTHQLVFGLWKGDLTLKRAIGAAFQRLQSDGTLATLTAKYLEG